VLSAGLWFRVRDGARHRSRFFFIAHLGAECRLKSITFSRSRMSSEKSSSRQIVIAWKVSGLSHTSPRSLYCGCLDPLGDGDLASRLSSSTDPISRQVHAYGVRSVCGPSFSGRASGPAPHHACFPCGTSVPPLGVFSSSASSSSITLMPIFGQHRHSTVPGICSELTDRAARTSVELIVGDIAFFRGFADSSFLTAAGSYQSEWPASWRQTRGLRSCL